MRRRGCRGRVRGGRMLAGRRGLIGLIHDRRGGMGGAGGAGRIGCGPVGGSGRDRRNRRDRHGRRRDISAALATLSTRFATFFRGHAPPPFPDNARWMWSGLAAAVSAAPQAKGRPFPTHALRAAQRTERHPSIVRVVARNPRVDYHGRFGATILPFPAAATVTAASCRYHARRRACSSPARTGARGGASDAHTA